MTHYEQSFIDTSWDLDNVDAVRRVIQSQSGRAHGGDQSLTPKRKQTKRQIATSGVPLLATFRTPAAAPENPGVALNDAVLLCQDSGPYKLDDIHQDLAVAHRLLDAAGAKSALTMTERLVTIAERWLSRAQHVASCQCRQCHAAHAVVRKCLEILRE